MQELPQEIAQADSAMSTSATRATALQLPAELGIEQVDALKTQFGLLIDVPETVALAAAGVERIHGAALQLLCLFCRERHAAGRAVELLEPSPIFRTAAVLFGASHLFQIAGNAA